MATLQFLLPFGLLFVFFANLCYGKNIIGTSSIMDSVADRKPSAYMETNSNLNVEDHLEVGTILSSADLDSSKYAFNFNTQDQSQKLLLKESPVKISSDTQKVRLKRSIPNNLAEFFKRAYKSPGLEGDVLYMAKKLSEVKFNIERGIFKNSDILAAELHLYKVAPKKLLPKRRHKTKKAVQARVSIHQVIRRGKRLPSTTKLLDSSLVFIDESGWMKFDITKAFKSWVRSRQSNKGIEVWVESIEPGNKAARIARKVKFVKPDNRKSTNRPALVVYFKEQGPKLSKNSH